jgi:Domain of unknown function (DUF4783)
MKKLLFLLMFLPAFAFAQGNANLDAIGKALGVGSAETLAKYFADNVEITIGDKEQNVARAQAIEAVRAFFNTSKPKSFTQMHQGMSKENSDQYCIGNLSAANGNYRVYLYLKSSGGTLTIKEIRFDKA